METLFIKGTEQTPKIDFNPDGNLLIEGISLPENVYAFFKSVDDWLDALKDHLPAQITLTLDIEYLNTASSVALLKILKKVIVYSASTQLKIVWKYFKDDDDMYDEGDKFQSLSKYTFDFVEK